MQVLLKPGHDRVQRHPLLGLQFRDAVSGEVVDEGLKVELHDLLRPHRVQPLLANRIGIFALHAAAGLHGFVVPPPPAVLSPSEPGRYQLQVRDGRRRYLPLCLVPELPGAGLWGPALTSPAGVAPFLEPFVPLFSAPTRVLPPALASLRVQLRRARQPGLPAPWARLELWLGSTRLAEGQADEGGRALLIFPLPRPRETTLGTSPAGRPPAFEWTVTLRAFWNPAFKTTVVPTLDEVFSQGALGLLQSLAPVLPLPPLLLQAGETLMAHRPPESYVYVAD